MDPLQNLDHSGARGHTGRPLAIGALALVARAEAVLRRARATRHTRELEFAPRVPADSGEVLRIADVTIDAGARTVRRRGRPVPLTRTEFDLLLHMARHRGELLAHAQLLRAAFPRRQVGSRTVVMHVSALRRKLGDDPAAPRIIETVWGLGYRVAG